MSTFLFLAGAGAGALLATILLLWAIRIFGRNTAEETKRSLQFHEQANRLLAERNELGAREVAWLSKIAGAFSARIGEIQPLTPTKLAIVAEISRAFTRLGAERGIFAAIHSWGDTLPEGEIAMMLRELNEQAKEVTPGEISALREMLADAYKELSGLAHHSSDCATSRAPAETPGRCNCGPNSGGTAVKS